MLPRHDIRFGPVKLEYVPVMQALQAEDPAKVKERVGMGGWWWWWGSKEIAECCLTTWEFRLNPNSSQVNLGKSLDRDRNQLPKCSRARDVTSRIASSDL